MWTCLLQLMQNIYLYIVVLFSHMNFLLYFKQCQRWNGPSVLSVRMYLVVHLGVGVNIQPNTSWLKAVNGHSLILIYTWLAQKITLTRLPINRIWVRYKCFESRYVRHDNMSRLRAILVWINSREKRAIYCLFAVHMRPTNPFEIKNLLRRYSGHLLLW